MYEHKNPKSESTEVGDICPYYLRGRCKFRDICTQYHGKLPYQWQYLADDDAWVSFDDDENQGIEELFCQPEKNGCTINAKEMKDNKK